MLIKYFNYSEFCSGQGYRDRGYWQSAIDSG